jgi:hypothetical protein
MAGLFFLTATRMGGPIFDVFASRRRSFQS